jgi:hypothetical protein
MQKALVGLAPLAVVLAAAGIAISWMLAREMTAGRWALAAFLIGHGWVHAMFIFPKPATTDGGTEWPFDMAQSWLVGSAGLDVKVVRVIGIAFLGVVAIGFLLAALTTIGFVVPAGWWPVLVVVSAAASALMLGLFFSPQLVLGLAIDAVLLWAVLASVWTPAAATP